MLTLLWCAVHFARRLRYPAVFCTRLKGCILSCISSHHWQWLTIISTFEKPVSERNPDRETKSRLSHRQARKVLADVPKVVEPAYLRITEETTKMARQLSTFNSMDECRVLDSELHGPSKHQHGSKAVEESRPHFELASHKLNHSVD